MKFVFFTALLMTILTAQSSLKNVTLQLKWFHQFQFAGFIVAKEKGFYKEVGLDVSFKEYNSSSYDIQNVIDGSTHFAVSDSALILEAIKGRPIVGMMPIYQISPYILMSLKSSKIRDIQDLNGKRVAVFKDLNGLAVKSVLKAHQIEYTPVHIDDKLGALKEGVVDSMIGYLSNEPFRAKEMGLEVSVIRPDHYGFERYGDILFTSAQMLQEDPKTVEQMYQGSKRGFEYAFEHIDETVELIYTKYNSKGKSKAALLYEANTLKKLSGYGTNFAHFSPDKVKSIAYIYSFAEPGVYNFKHLDTFVYTPKNQKNLILTEEERAYLKKKQSITVCFPKEQAPFTMINNHEPEGVSIDYFRLIEQKLDIRFAFIATDTYAQQFKLVREGKCETVPMLFSHPQSLPILVETRPVGKDTLSLVTRNDAPYIFDLATLKKQKIGINAQDVNTYNYIKNSYPYFNYVPLDETSLEKVANGELYGFIGSSVQMSYLVSTKYRQKLKVMTVLKNSEFSAGMGVRSDNPMLLSILNKTIDSLDTNDVEKLFQKWIHIQYKEVTDHTLVYQILSVSLVIFSIIIYWNRRLNREIKHKKRAQIQLAQSEEKFRTLFDVAPIMLNSFDDNGRCVLWNKECEKVFGWQVKEINRYENVFALFYPNPVDQEALKASFDSQNINRFSEWHPITKEGKILATLWANTVLPSGEAISIGLDVTKQREAEREVALKNEQLEATKAQLEKLNAELKDIVAQEVEKSRQKDLILQQQSKMASMGEMIENIAHQWRQPLAQINSSILVIDATMKKNSFHHAKIEKKLLEMESLTEYMSKTINDFQNFFNPDKKAEKFLVSKAVTDALLIIKGSFASHYIDVMTNLTEEIVCNGYKSELQQVIVVILNNAKDALVTRKITDPKVTITLLDKGANFLISFCDNAKGIEPHVMEKIFDPYFTTKHSSQGTGLGLYISKMIIEDGLKGTLTVSNDAEGACFKILLSKGVL